MILAKNKILEEIKNKTIQITPFKKSNVGSASVDLTLGNEFGIFKDHKKVVLSESNGYHKKIKKIKSKSYTLMPGEFILGITQEKVKLPNNICAFLEGRSRYARYGLTIHSTAPFIHPGVNNRQVFEIRNDANFPIELKEGLRVCQLIFARMDGEAKHAGKFRKQKSF